MCYGRKDLESCYSSADCHAGYYCKEKSDYPHLTQCKLLLTSYERCINTEQCAHNLYCWYANKDSSPINGRTTDSKQCLPMYSQRPGYNYGWFSSNPNDMNSITLQDFQMNGKYCKSGLAYYNKVELTSTCTETSKVTQFSEET